MTFVAGTLILLASSNFLGDYITQRTPSVIQTQMTKEKPTLFNYTQAGNHFGISIMDHGIGRFLSFGEIQAIFTPMVINLGDS